jgi:alcohol dehydrogenase
MLMKLEVVRPVIESLKTFNIDYTVCDEVSIEPTVTLFENLVDNLDQKKFDSVFAVGGGSVIDVAKGVAIVAQFDGHIRDYSGLNKVPAPLERKLIAVPTTAGTGSKISDGSVFIDEAIQSKFLVLSNFICPKVAITDPELTMLMPPEITANSGVDTLTHGIESYLSKDASVATRLFSIKAVELISSGLKTAYYNGENIDACDNRTGWGNNGHGRWNECTYGVMSCHGNAHLCPLSYAPRPGVRHGPSPCSGLQCGGSRRKGDRYLQGYGNDRQGREE